MGPARTDLLGKMKHKHERRLVPREAHTPRTHTHAAPPSELCTLPFFLSL
jgi:hypothetical protein